MKKIIIVVIFFLLIGLFAGIFGASKSRSLQDHQVKKITYTISPVGVAEFNDLGVVELKGQQVRLHKLKTQIFGFSDDEKIYSDLKTLLPIRIERDIFRWFRRERIIESYDQENFVLTIEKFKGKRKVKEFVIQRDGPINNAILALFDLRTIIEPKVGMSFNVNLPTQFQIKVASQDKIKIRKDIFEAYHFISDPNRFEVWISNDERRIPLKMKLRIGIGYTLVLKEYLDEKEKR